MKYPHVQPFNKQQAIENQGLAQTNNLKRRQVDFTAMIGQPRIGNGHRDANGYKKPGSVKK